MNNKIEERKIQVPLIKTLYNLVLEKPCILYWEKCGQRFGVAEIWHVPRGVAEQGDQRDVFRMKC